MKYLELQLQLQLDHQNLQLDQFKKQQQQQKQAPKIIPTVTGKLASPLMPHTKQRVNYISLLLNIATQSAEAATVSRKKAHCLFIAMNRSRHKL